MRNKANLFPEDLIALAGSAKALAHPARIRILQVLAECNTCITGELVEQLPLAQATVSQHLRELKSAGFILGEIRGPRTCYCIDHQALEKAKNEFTELFKTISKTSIQEVKCQPQRK